MTAAARKYVDDLSGVEYPPARVDDNGNPVFKLPKPVPSVLCVMPTPCGKCHYCKIANFGPLYWLRAS